MSKYTYIDNGVVFNIEDNAKMAFSKITNMDGSIKNGDIVPVINGVEIDWNGVQMAIGTGVRTINTTSDLIKAIQASSNYTASQGRTGAQGRYGLQGTAGMQGLRGMQGIAGPGAGSTGIQGLAGAQGRTGIQGSAGYQGRTGVQGLMGPQGIAGPGAGSTGMQGLVGSQGRTGAQGAAGYIGIQGTTGTIGKIGMQGTTGAQGPMTSEFNSFKTEVNAKLEEIYSRLAALEAANN